MTASGGKRTSAALTHYMILKMPKTPFGRASVFNLCAIAGFFGTFILAPDSVELPLMLTWMAVAGGGMLFVGCPKCGKSLFRRGVFYVPWPATECSKCGTDLTTDHPTK
jgi:hypothetical protein